MRNRGLVVAVVASLCLNVAVVGTYFFRRARRDRPHRLRGLTAEARENLRRAREAAMPEFATLADRVETTDSILWDEMRSESPDSARVESLCQELGQIHGRMKAVVCRQMHHELLLMPAEARTDYLKHMMRMKPGFGGPGRGTGRHQGRGHGMHPSPGVEPPPDGPLPEPESGS